MQYYTNNQGNDGFGAQFQRIIVNYLYAKKNNLEFLYNPFKYVDHNYNNNPRFIDEIENLINLKNNIKNNYHNSNAIEINFKCNEFEQDIENYCNSNYMKFIKNCFWENKNKNVFNNNKLNIAVHIRRPNPRDTRIDGANTPDIYYLNIINNIRNRYNNKDLQFHIYSQGSENNFNLYKQNDISLHLNEDICSTFIAMVGADILLTSRSSLSYTAALLSDGIIYYKKFWHKPRKDWIIFD